MGNKLAKLKHKNLGDLSSFSSHHEDAPKSYIYDTRTFPTHLNKNKSLISNTRNPPATSSILSSYNEKPPPVPLKPPPSSRHAGGGILSTTGSKPDSNSTLTYSPSSRSTTRAPTILTQPSNETLILKSESALNFPVSLDSHDNNLLAVDIFSYPQVPVTTNLSEKTLINATTQLAPALEITEEEVLVGPSLSTVQFECYHNHQYMRKSRNKLCPVACMICQKKDKEMRWTCTWCYLSACADCTHLLSKTPGKDLRVCLDKLDTSRELGQPKPLVKTSKQVQTL